MNTYRMNEAICGLKTAPKTMSSMLMLVTIRNRIVYLLLSMISQVFPSISVLVIILRKPRFVKHELYQI